MAYEYKNSRGEVYYLHVKEVAPRGQKARPLYFFSKKQGGKSGKEQVLDTLPEGRVVAENPRNGFPTLKKA